MKSLSLVPFLIAGALVGCRSDSAREAVPALTESSGLEEVRIVSKGLE